MKHVRHSMIALALLVAACGGTGSPPSSAASTSPATATEIASGGEGARAVSAGTLSLTGGASPRALGGPLSPDYADMTRWDPDQGRLTAYFGTGDAAFGLNLNLGAPFEVGEREVRTGPVSFETGEGFGERIDVREAHVKVEALDVAQRTIRLRIEGHTAVDGAAASEMFALEATVAVPAAD